MNRFQAEVDMVTAIRKDENVSIGLQRLMVGVGWTGDDKPGEFDLDITACMLNDKDKLPSDEYFVFYNNLHSPDMACRLSEDCQSMGSISGDDLEEIIIDLTQIDPQIAAIVFSVSIYDEEGKQTFGQIKQAHVRIYDLDTEEELYRYELNEDFSGESAVEFGRLYLKDHKWNFKALGTPHAKGLEGIVDKYCTHE